MRSGKSFRLKKFRAKDRTLTHSPIWTRSLLTHTYVVSAHVDTLILPPKQSLIFIFSLILSHRPIHTFARQAECKEIFVDEFWIAKFDGQLRHCEREQDLRMWGRRFVNAISQIFHCTHGTLHSLQDTLLHTPLPAPRYSAAALCTAAFSRSTLHSLQDPLLHTPLPASRYSAAAPCTFCIIHRCTHDACTVK